MRRPYNLERYRETALKVRAAAPPTGLTSDIIAGFPGETENAFQNTLDRIREFGFADLHPFPYSDRPGTPGEAMFPKVSPSVIRERMRALWKLKKECLARSAAEAKGKIYRVIVERHRDGWKAGLTDQGLRVIFPGPESLLGREAEIRVTTNSKGQALGEVVG
jgi:threonylcarbamoyladenosine tRNA methylthiotransferase MtaB